MASSRDYYPVFLDLRGRSCLVVGGGHVVARKVKTLLDCGARVTLVAPEILPEITAHQADGLPLTCHTRRYASEDMKGVFLVIAGTDAPEVNGQVAADAEKAGALCNAVDDPPNCTFIVPATVSRGHLTIAVSTDGHGPAVAREIRKELEQCYGPEYEVLLDMLEEYRPRIKALPGLRKKETWDLIARPETVAAIRDGRADSVRTMIEELLA